MRLGRRRAFSSPIVGSLLDVAAASVSRTHPAEEPATPRNNNIMSILGRLVHRYGGTNPETDECSLAGGVASSSVVGLQNAL